MVKHSARFVLAAIVKFVAEAAVALKPKYLLGSPTFWKE